MTVVVCRAQTSPSCLDGHPAAEQFGEDMPLAEDGTFDGSSIVCDLCYVQLMPLTPSGKALLGELPAAIASLRARVA